MLMQDNMPGRGYGEAAGRYHRVRSLGHSLFRCDHDLVLYRGLLYTRSPRCYELVGFESATSVEAAVVAEIETRSCLRHMRF